MGKRNMIRNREYRKIAQDCRYKTESCIIQYDEQYHVPSQSFSSRIDNDRE